MSSHFDGFVPICSICYSIFHPTEGTKIKFQFPPNSLENNGINFDTIKNYVIPKPQLCNTLLTFKYSSFRLVCYPVNVNASFYARNSFSFNFVFIFPYDCATSPYEPSIARLGKMFRVLEEQSQILSKAEKDPIYYHLKGQGSSSITDQGSETILDLDSTNTKEANDTHQRKGYTFEKYHEIMKDLMKDKGFSINDIVTKLYQDLNNYSECLIPIDSGNAIDIKLFPLLPPPNSCISFEDVPISVVNLPKLIDVNWDPTMLKIVPHINGINSIAKISQLSNSDVQLVIECIKHLIYYNCVVLSDIFQFTNVYAPTSLIREFLTDSTLAQDCQLYVISTEFSNFNILPFDGPTGTPNNSSFKTHHSNGSINIVKKRASNTGESVSSNGDIPLHWNLSSQSLVQCSHKYLDGTQYNYNGSKIILPTKSILFDLYRSLCQGQTVKEWYRTNFDMLQENRVDVRRFITFGLIKKIIYRCYSYPIAKNINNLEALKIFQSTKDVEHSKSKLSDNVFSTADIRVDFDNDFEPIYRRKEFYSRSVNPTDDNVNRFYGELPKESDTNILNGNCQLKKFYQIRKCNQISTDYTAEGSDSIQSSNQFFDDDSGNTPSHGYGDTKNILRLLRSKRREEYLLLKSIRDVDSFDKVCTCLEKDKQEVEELLHTLGHFNIVNS